MTQTEHPGLKRFMSSAGALELHLDPGPRLPDCGSGYLTLDLRGPLGSLYLQDLRAQLHAFTQDLGLQVPAVLLLQTDKRRLGGKILTRFSSRI